MLPPEPTAVIASFPRRNDSSESNYWDNKVEVTDECCSVYNRLSGFFSIRHSEETHKDVRKSEQTEHQCETKRERLYWALDKSAGLEHFRSDLCLNSGIKVSWVEAELRECKNCKHCNTEEKKGKP